MKRPEVGDAVRYRRVGGGNRTMYEGVVVTSRCSECGPDVVHVSRGDGEALHHVPLDTVWCVISGGFVDVADAT